MTSFETQALLDETSVRVVVRDATHLEQFLESLMHLGRTATAVVLSTTGEGRPVTPLAG